MPRNTSVENAVSDALARIDAYIGGETVSLPPPAARHEADRALAHRSASVRLASMFLAFYAAREPGWDFERVPKGVRGQYGDKRLADALNTRHITLHDSITAFGENLGWKGNVQNVRLPNDPRFRDFVAALKAADSKARRLVADYMAAKFAQSRREQAAAGTGSAGTGSGGNGVGNRSGFPLGTGALRATAGSAGNAFSFRPKSANPRPRAS